MKKYLIIIIIGLAITAVIGIIAAVAYNKRQSKLTDEGKPDTPQKPVQDTADGILIATTPSLQGYIITKYIKVVSAETILGTGFFTEFAAWVADLFSIESSAVERKFKIARNSSLRKLRQQALAAGADAVIGTTFAYSSNSRSMVSVIVTGTAVNALPAQD